MELKVNSSIPVHFEVNNEIEDTRFLKGKLWVMHTGLNPNRSAFEKSVIEASVHSLANIPIVGFIQANNVNELDFRGHEQRLVIDDNGVRIEYIGRPYGLVPESNNAQFETKLDSNGVERDYLTVEVLLWRKFPECIEIVERDGTVNHSMELHPPSIEGSFDSNKVFQFSKFAFEALCLIGRDVPPAMVGSLLEQYTKNTSQTTMFTELLTEFNAHFAKYQENNSSALSEKDVVENKGGDNVDEKLELFTKYSTLNEVDIAELKANIENYSIEELETKLQELSEFKQNEEDNEREDAPSNFTLTAQQTEQEIRKTLSSEKFTDRWGDSVRSFYYIDHDSNRVYAEDVQNSYTPVGLNYAVNGDFITIDFTTKKRIKFVPQDMEGEQEVLTSFVSLERSEFETEKVKTDFNEKIETCKTELGNLQTEFTTLKEVNETIQTKLTKFSETNIEQLQQEVETLRAFKLEKEKNEKLSVIEKFTQLNDEDVQPYKEQIDKFTVEELELQLFALVGKKGLQFSANTDTKESNLMFALNDNIKSTNSNVPAWAEFVEQYKSKQKQ
ncbi:hypothetical protein ACFQZE_07335 [Paenibacillus sp. GCM10027627]|uniref:hypothetical protein n=1 Tax=unclassified Paenibacillus TaxID=185978 RepID=UPI00363CE9FA